MTQDLIRQYIDLAISYGRSLLSAQTGYIHYCYHPKSVKELRETIPLYENVLFALALFRNKQAEQMIEAKGFLNRLLSFQAVTQFPVYLHEYPVCHDHFLGVLLLAPFYWIKKHFHFILGAELNARLDDAIQKLLFFYNAPEQTIKPKYPIAIQLACAEIAWGEFTNNADLKQEGQKRLDFLYLMGIDASWYSPQQLGLMLASLQMVYPSLSMSPWVNMWRHFEATWHEPTHAYIGPGYDEHFEKEQPQVTLYDYFGGLCAGKLSSRCLKPNHALLLAPLLQCTEDQLIEPRRTLFAYSLIDQEQPVPSKERSFHTFKFLWGDLKHTHSLVLQGRNAIQCAKKEANELYFHVDLAEIPELDFKERGREICFYFDANERTNVYVNDVASTTFQLNDEVIIRSGGIVVGMTFTLECGDGDFLGHIMPGNRLSQFACKHEFPYQAFDRQVFLRTVRREENCRIGVILRFA